MIGIFNLSRLALVAFFTPASGKIHIATTMKTAVTMMKVEKSGRMGDPLQ